MTGLITRKWRWAFLAGYVVILLSSMVLNRPVTSSVKMITHPFFTGKKNPKLTYEKIANIIAFIPIGLLAGKKWWGLFFGIGFSAVVECLQLKLHRGLFEVDDLILNTAGTLIGVLAALFLMLLYYLFFGRRRKKKKWNFSWDYPVSAAEKSLSGETP